MKDLNSTKKWSTIMKLKFTLIALLATLNLSALTIGKVPKEVTISGDKGGMITDGSEWNSKILKDKVYVIFYVDPDKKSVNEHFSRALKKKNYREKGNFQTFAIINLAATWTPNFLIEKVLKSKQKEFPTTIYVKDKKSVLVKEWQIADDASNILIFDKTGKLIFYKTGKMQDEDMKKAFALIEANL